MHIFACQFDILWENRSGNLDKVRELLSEHTIPEGSLIVLPEMFASGFSMNVDRVKEDEPSDTEAFMANLAAQYKSCVIGGLVFKHESGKGLNCLSVFGPDGNKIGGYQKNHCFSYSGETDYYISGADIFTFGWQGFTICPTICYDLRFPELYRRGVIAGANLFTVIASWPSTRTNHWDTLLQARAIENQAIVVGNNRVGTDPKFQYIGHSQIIDHQGEVLEINEGDETCVSAEVSIDSLQAWRDDFRALDDMKPQ